MLHAPPPAPKAAPTAPAAVRSAVLADFRANPFRVLRLPATAGPDEVVWRAEGLLAPARAGMAPDEPDPQPETSFSDSLRKPADYLSKPRTRPARRHGADACVINATGVVKVQAMVGLALGVRVYYRHERFGTAVGVPRLTAADLGHRL